MAKNTPGVALRHCARGKHAPASQLSGRWSAIVDRALTKDPARRFQSAAEFINAIEGRATFTLPETETLPPSSAPAPRRRKQFKKWLAAAAMAVALSGIGIGLNLNRGPVALTPRPKHLAVLPFVNIGDTATLVVIDGLLETLTSRLSELDRSGKTLWVVPASEVRQRKVTQPADAVKQLGVNLVVTGSVRSKKRNSVRLTVNLVNPPQPAADRDQATISESDGDYSDLWKTARLCKAGRAVASERAKGLRLRSGPFAA